MGAGVIVAVPSLERTTFRTSRLLEFCSRKELVAQTGHEPDAWPLVVLKELVDNALDACEEAGFAPEIGVQVEPGAITVVDNGPGMPPETVTNILDFSSRVSSREAYVAPDRGAQGNALKTILAMPFVLDGAAGRVEICAHGLRHQIEFTVDALRQAPLIRHRHEQCDVRNGTSMTVAWPESAGLMLAEAEQRFLQIAEDYTWLNPHLTLTLTWFGERSTVRATDPSWRKWQPSDPTCPHWYTPQHLERLIAAYLTHDIEHGCERTVREFVSEFRGLSGSLKQKAVLAATGLQRAPLASLCDGSAIDRAVAAGLLDAMIAHTRPVKPEALGIIGKDHLYWRLEAVGCEMASFQYKQVKSKEPGLPWVIEAAFAWCPDLTSRRLITGVNWSPGIVNPFRALGPYRQSLDTVLTQQRADRDDPVVVFLHLACPRVEYTDRGKSAVVIAR
jgi:DNA topoisomerase VI subunit B